MATAVHAQAPSAGGEPFTWDQRWRHYVHRTYSWQRLGLLAVDTGFDHLTGEPREWGRTPRSYGYRYASSLGKRVVRNSVELGLGAALGEDCRFRASRAAGFRNRLRFAVVESFTARRGSGRAFAYSRLAASAGGILVSSRWDPQPLSAARFGEQIGFSYLGHLQNSLLNEFGGDMKAAGRAVRKRLARSLFGAAP